MKFFLYAILLTAVCMVVSDTICFGQTPSIIKGQIDTMEVKCQTCIDAGTNNFVTCENIFYHQMDSILNGAYKALKKQLDTATFENLKKEQRIWLKKRDVYFKKQDAKIGTEGGGIEADKALAIHQKALYVKERILCLLTYMK